MTDELFELHVGLPTGSYGPVEAFRHFKWKEVLTSYPGPQSLPLFDGHRVDGTLARIGTARPHSLDEVAQFVSLLSSDLWDLGTRIEVEHQATTILSGKQQRAEATMLSTLEEDWLCVPAPGFEVHVAFPSLVVGSYSPQGPLLEVPFFEATTFSGTSLTVVTIVGETVDEVLGVQRELGAAASRRGGAEHSAVLERVVGAWKPAR
jgi:hypothetical protein